MAQKPSAPQAVPNAKESPATPTWLFLFYKWVTTTLSGLFPGTAGNVIYSDGAGGVSNEDAFNYNSTTNALAVGSVSATTTLTAGTGITATTGNITATAGNFVLTAGYLDLAEIADPGLAAANHVYLHAEDVAGITQVHHNNSQHKWTVGQDNYIVCRNTSGGQITKGQAVYITGSTGQRPEIALADADSHHHGLGIAQDTMANNGYGAVVTHGYAKELDTSAWTAGDALYLSGTAGGLTTTRPTFPAAAQRIAVVVYSHANNGILFVHHHSDSRESDGAWDTPFSIGDGSTAGELRLLEPSGTQYTAFKAQAQAGNVTYILPAAHATNGVLLNDGSGNLAWDTNISDLIDHGLLTGLGDNDHTQYVNAVSDTSTIDLTLTGQSISGTVIVAGLSGIDHGSQLTGLADDDHTQYVLLVGRSGGQIVRGGTGASDALTLRSTSNATKGLVALADEGGNVTIGGGTSASELRFLEPSGSGTNYTAFKAQAQAGSVTYTLPAADGSPNQVLSTNGSGTLSWATAGSGSDKTPMTPQGRLTLATATPVMSSEQANKTTIYYTPYQGDVIPLYDGSAWTNTTFTELTLSMAGSANWAANSNYDLYVYNDGGTLRLGTGAAWTSDTARNESLTMVNGILTNAATMTLRYGASSTVSVAANRATYVGTMRTSAAGTTTWERQPAAGTVGQLYVWNCYNRVRVEAMVRESTDSWTYNSTTWRAYNGGGTPACKVSFVRGLAEDDMHAVGNPFAYSNTANENARTGIGLDSTTAYAGLSGWNTFAAAGAIGQQICAYAGPVAIGHHYLQMMESSTATGVCTFFGDSSFPTIIQVGLTVSGMF